MRHDSDFCLSNKLAAVAACIVLLGTPGPAMIAQAQSLSSPAPVPQLSGTWRPATCLPDGETCPFVIAGLQLTRVGQGLVDVFEEPIGPKFDCFQATVPSLLADPYAWSIHQLTDRVIFEYEKDDIVRTVWLEGWNHPTPGPYDANWIGHSRGWYEGDELVVVTNRFMFDPTGLEDLGGIPSSTLKQVTVRYSRRGDRLHAEALTEDPLILEAPIHFSFEWTPTDEALLLPYSCELDQARLAIQYADPSRSINVRTIGQAEPTRGGQAAGSGND